MKTNRLSHLIAFFCCLLVSSLAYSQCDDPIIDIDGDINSTVCSGETIDLRVIPSSCMGADTYDFNWSDGSTGVNLQTIEVTVPTNGGPSALDTIYSVIVMDGATLIGTDSITITVLPEMSVSVAVGASPPHCVGNDINLVATVVGGSGTGYSTNWTNVDIENGLLAVDQDAPLTTIYTINVTDSEGCVATSPSTAFNANPMPGPISITGDLEFCVGESMTLNISPTDSDFDCTWTKDGNATSSSNCILIRDPISLSDEGDYVVTVTNSVTQCASQSPAVSVQVEFLEITLTPDIGPNGVCANDGPIELNLSPSLGTLNPFTLTSSPPSGAIVGDEFHPQISGPGTFVITYEGTFGFCTESASTTIVVKALPVVTLDPIPTVCNINSIIDLNDFVSESGGSFTFSDDSEFDGIFAPVDTTDNINLQFNYLFTGVNGCTVSTPGILPINPELVANTDPNFTICQGFETALGVSPVGGGGGYIYNWSNANFIDNQNAQSPVLLTSVPVGTHNFGLILEDVNGCIAENSQSAVINPQAEISISQDPAVFCEGESLTLSATFTGGVGDPEYFWNNDNITPNQPNTFNTDPITEPTSIPVLISFENSTGCANASNTLIATPSESPDPTIVSIPESNTVCANQVSVFFASERKTGSLLTWSILGAASNVDSSFVNDDKFWVYWSSDLSGNTSIQLEEYLSEICQAVEEFPVNFSTDEAPPLSEIYYSELNGILYYNMSGLCYNWGYIDPNPNLGTNPPEPYVNFDIDQNHYQSLIVGTLDTTLTYFCQTWIPGDCGDISGACSNTILFDAKRNTPPTQSPEAELEFKVFPNPNNGSFNFQFGNLTPEQNYSWELRNVLGQVIQEGNFTPQNENFSGSIQAKNQSGGIYLLTVFDHGEIKNVARIVIRD